MKRATGLMASGLVLLLVSTASAIDPSFWVWQRKGALEASEIAGLNQARAKELYWHVGTLVLQGSQWSWREQLPVDFFALKKSASFIHFIPVVRLEPVAGQFPSAENQSQLISILNEVVHTAGADELQIDYECPDRLMSHYEDFLRSLKEQGRPWRLSISALGHWSKFAHDFQGLTDELTPMFYDFNPSRESMSGNLLPSLIDGPAAEKQIEGWKNCTLPWKAGLPNFSRVTVVNADGFNRGNIRSWLWDELWFSSLLAPLNFTTDGQTVFTVTHSGVLADTPVREQEKIVVRYPELASLRKLEHIAEQAGSSGIIFFRLADSRDMSGYSVENLNQLPTASPVLTVKWTASGRLSVTNDTKDDLMPLVSASGERGYALELEAKAGSWREAIPGDFARVTTDSQGTRLVDDAIGLDATTIYFWFSHLRAGQTLETGLVQRISVEPVRWRIHNFDPQTSWHSLE